MWIGQLLHGTATRLRTAAQSVRAAAYALRTLMLMRCRYTLEPHERRVECAAQGSRAKSLDASRPALFTYCIQLGTQNKLVLQVSSVVRPGARTGGRPLRHDLSGICMPKQRVRWSSIVHGVPRSMLTLSRLLRPALDTESTECVQHGSTQTTCHSVQRSTPCSTDPAGSTHQRWKLGNRVVSKITKHESSHLDG